MEKAILRTLAYADIFDYPLTSEEIFRFLVADKPVGSDVLKKTLVEMGRDGAKVGSDVPEKLFFLPGRKGLVSCRKKRAKISQEKLKLARRAAQFLKIIPTIKLVGITGRLAMENAEKEDDIDFLIITSRNRLWLTRLLAVVVLELLGKRRRPEQKKVKNKICLNMFLDEDRLALSSQERDLYTAHEVIQMKPLWNRDQTHAKFLKANQWVIDYLPNSLAGNQFETSSQRQRKGVSLGGLFNLFESLARRLQFCYMSRRQTREVVTSHRALFHPESARGWVFEGYRRRLAEKRLSESD